MESEVETMFFCFNIIPHFSAQMCTWNQKLKQCSFVSTLYHTFGVGLIVTEVTTVEPTYIYLPGDMSICDDSYIEGWKKLTGTWNQKLKQCSFVSTLYHTFENVKIGSFATKTKIIS